MTIYSGIFNSINGDRKYNAWWFAKYFATFIGNGVFPNPSTGLQVMADERMQVKVRPGSGWVDGYFLYSDTDHVLKLDVSDGVLKRIDRIVMRLDYLTRKIDIVVKNGVLSSKPTAPTLQRDTDYVELALADVYITNGATQITQAAITDQRFNSILCGIVKGTIDQIDTTNLFAQYQDAFDNFMKELEDTLSGDVAANLQNRINTHINDTDKHITPTERTTWNNKASTAVATQSSNGLMSSADKGKLDGIVDGTTAKKGLVQLEDSVKSTSVTKAATPKSVKQAFDLAKFAKEGLGAYVQDSGRDGYSLYNCDVEDGNLSLDVKENVNYEHVPINNRVQINSNNYGGFKFSTKTVSATKLKVNFSVDIYQSVSKVQILNAVKNVIYTGTILSHTVDGLIAEFTGINLSPNTTYYVGVLYTTTGSMGAITSTQNNHYPVNLSGLSIDAGLWNSSDTTQNWIGLRQLEVECYELETSGYAEKLIKPHELKSWGFLDFIRTVGGGTATVSILSESNVVIKSNITSPQDISDIDSVTYPIIKLRFNLSRTDLTQTSPTFSKPQITYKAADVLIDEVTGKPYKLFVSNGTLGIREV